MLHGCGWGAAGSGVIHRVLTPSAEPSGPGGSALLPGIEQPHPCGPEISQVARRCHQVVHEGRGGDQAVAKGLGIRPMQGPCRAALRRAKAASTPGMRPAKAGSTARSAPRQPPWRRPTSLSPDKAGPSGLLVMRRVAPAEAKAQLSALLDAVEAGEEVVITRRGKDGARVVREKPAALAASGWVERLRELHRDQPPLQGSAVRLLRELRDQEP